MWSGTKNYIFIFTVLFSHVLIPKLIASPFDTFLLVHGALFTSEGWANLSNELTAQGHNVLDMNVPGRTGDGVDAKDATLEAAVVKLCTLAELQPGNVILVGHSQGGALITQAVGKCGHKIKGLVYVTAVVPLNGETAFDGLNQERDTSFAQCVTVDDSRKLFVIKKDGPLEESFFHDVRATNSELADRSLAGMVNEPMAIGTTKLNFPQLLYDAIPKYYIEASLDKVISLETQKSYQEKVKMRAVYTLGTSHSPFLSQPKELAKALISSKENINALTEKDTAEKTVIKNFYHAFKKGDFATLGSLMDENIVWHQPGFNRFSGLREGRDNILRFFERLGRTTGLSLRLDPQFVMQNNEEVTVVVHYSANRLGKILRGTGVDTYTVKDGKIIKAVLFSENQRVEDAFWAN